MSARPQRGAGHLGSYADVESDGDDARDTGKQGKRKAPPKKGDDDDDDEWTEDVQLVKQKRSALTTKSTRKALTDGDAVRVERGRVIVDGAVPLLWRLGSQNLSRTDSPLLRVIDAAAARLKARVPALIPIRQLCANEAASVAQPPMSPAALAILVTRADELGYQRDKNRGTAQGPLLDAWAKLDDALGEWLRSIFTWAGEKGAIINVFLNVNGGGIVDVDGSSKMGWHTDKPTEGRKGVTNNGRIVLYYMNGSGGALDACGTLSVREGGREQTMIMQRGTALVATNKLLTAQGVEHKHAALGRGISIVIEMEFKEGAVTSSSSAAIAAANAAQLPLLILEAIPEWTPETLFLGANRKYGQVGVMTKRRAAMSGVAGPVGARVVTNKRSRRLVDAFTPAELKEAAAVPIQRRFYDLEAEAFVTAKAWRKLPKDERVLIDGGGAAAKGSTDKYDEVTGLWTRYKKAAGGKLGGEASRRVPGDIVRVELVNEEGETWLLDTERELQLSVELKRPTHPFLMLNKAKVTELGFGSYFKTKAASARQLKVNVRSGATCHVGEKVPLAAHSLGASDKEGWVGAQLRLIFVRAAEEGAGAAGGTPARKAKAFRKAKTKSGR